jgi:hypothetical protein
MEGLLERGIGMRGNSFKGCFELNDFDLISWGGVWGLVGSLVGALHIFVLTRFLGVEG